MLVFSKGVSIYHEHALQEYNFWVGRVIENSILVHAISGDSPSGLLVESDCVATVDTPVSTGDGTPCALFLSFIACVFSSGALEPEGCLPVLLDQGKFPCCMKR